MSNLSHQQDLNDWIADWAMEEGSAIDIWGNTQEWIEVRRLSELGVELKISQSHEEIKRLLWSGYEIVAEEDNCGQIDCILKRTPKPVFKKTNNESTSLAEKVLAKFRESGDEEYREIWWNVEKVGGAVGVDFVGDDGITRDEYVLHTRSAEEAEKYANQFDGGITREELLRLGFVRVDPEELTSQQVSGKVYRGSHVPGSLDDRLGDD